MQTFQTGQKSPLDALAPQWTEQQPLTLQARVSGPEPEYDLILFGLDAESRLSDDRYTVFYNQPQSPEGALSQRSGPRQERVFTLELGRLPSHIERLSLAATTEQGSFAAIDFAEITLSLGTQPLLNYRVTGRDFQAQRAIMLLDLYRHAGRWRVGAIGQGFNGGLAALITHFGGTVSDLPAPTQPAAPTAPPTPIPPASPSPAVATQNVGLQKVVLDKQGASARISLRKGGGAEPIRVNLNWERGHGAATRGRFDFSHMTGQGGADLDLGCMYVLNDGDMGVIQALGNRFGSDRFAPYIMLDKDDRTGLADDGENLTIFRPDLIHTVLIFAFIYEGTSDFTHVGGRLRLTDPQGNEIAVNLSNPDMHRTFCAIATIENFGGDIRVTKEERYFRDHQECDAHFGFGFRWGAGSK